MANAISLSRLILALPFVWILSREELAGTAAVLLALAIFSDLIDGPIARRTGQASAGGRLLDHGADFVFVTSGLAVLASRGVIPWALPVLISVAFLQYILDSALMHAIRKGTEPSIDAAAAPPALRMSQLGRYNGILYFFPLGGDILVRLGLGFLAGPTLWLAWGLVGTTALSMVDRGWSLHLRRARG